MPPYEALQSQITHVHGFMAGPPILLSFVGANIGKVVWLIMQAALLTLHTVKDLHPERQLTRSLLWEEPQSGRTADVNGSLAECSLLQTGGGVDGSVAKRPGRCVI